jgi:hypothetical protein
MRTIASAVAPVTPLHPQVDESTCGRVAVWRCPLYMPARHPNGARPELV